MTSVLMFIALDLIEFYCSVVAEQIRWLSKLWCSSSFLIDETRGLKSYWEQFWHINVFGRAVHLETDHFELKVILLSIHRWHFLSQWVTTPDCCHSVCVCVWMWMIVRTLNSTDSKGLTAGRSFYTLRWIFVENFDSKPSHIYLPQQLTAAVLLNVLVL